MKSLPAVWEIFKEMNDPCLIVDQDFQIRDFNLSFQRTFNFDRDFIQYQPLPKFTHPDDRKLEIECFIDLFYGKKRSRRIKKRICRDINNPILVEQIFTILPEDPEKENKTALVVIHPLRNREVKNPGNNKDILPLINKSLSFIGLINRSDIISSYNLELISKITCIIEQIKEEMTLEIKKPG